MLRRYFAGCWVVLIGVLHLTGCSTMQNNIMQAYPQDAAYYIDKQQQIMTADQQQVAANYLQHYFSPWTGQQRLLTNQQILQQENEVLAQFIRAPGFAQNQERLSKNWVMNIAANMDLKRFPNHVAKAITTRVTYVRSLPSEAPSFPALQPAWDNYPFDDLQTSLLPANTPILVLQTTQDQAWVLVLAHNVIGWIAASDFAYVNAVFIQQWQTKQWLAPLVDGVPLVAEQHYRFSARLGTLLPLKEINNNDYTVLIAVADKNKNAAIEHAVINKQQATVFPLAATPANFIAVINSQMGHLYGWGGLYGYRDCSSTLEDIFAPFGIWLPRNSQDQALMGKVNDLKGLTTQQKEQVLLEKGVPLLTLVRLPGHIMLYLGRRDGHAYVLQNAWGLHTKNWLTGKTGRRLMTKTFIAPIDYDESAFNSENMLGRISSINILVSASVD